MNTYPYAMLLLEISEFLTHRPEDATELTNRQQRMLRRIIEFLQKVLAGHDMVTAQNALVPDLSRLNPYTFASRALHYSAPNLASRNGELKQKLFEKAISLLEEIEAGVPLASLPSATVGEVCELFDHLAEFAFSATDQFVNKSQMEFLGVLDYYFFSDGLNHFSSPNS